MLPEVPLHIGEQWWAGIVVSLGGSIVVKQIRMLCRASVLRGHGPWIDVRSIGKMKDDGVLQVSTKKGATTIQIDQQ